MPDPTLDELCAGRTETPEAVRRLIDEGRAGEADLTEADLAEGFLIGNAVRGLVRARLIEAKAKAAP